MATTRRRKRLKAADGSAKQVLPDDLVLEIVSRCRTARDVIRCAATSKPIRRGILSPPFLRRLQRFLLRDGRDRSFIPSVLLGLYPKTNDPDRPLAFVPPPGGHAGNGYPPSVAALPPAPAGERHAGACRYGAYLPVASCRSLLVLRRHCRVTEREHLTERHGLYPVELSACNPTTGERVVLPPLDVLDTSHAVLDVDPLAAPSTQFKLLVAELTENKPKTLYAQIFSSETGDWEPVLACPISRRCAFVPGPGRRPAGPVVVGDTAHWLCNTDEGKRILSWRWRGGDQKTSLHKLPLPSLENWGPEMCLAVMPAAAPQQEASSVLSLIVLDRGEIQLWVREKQRAGRQFAWAMRRRVQGTDVALPTGFSDGWLYHAELVSFSAGSGALFLRECESSLVSLVLNNKLDCNGRATETTTWDLQPAEAEFCPYEIDLLTYMLFVMKTF